MIPGFNRKERREMAKEGKVTQQFVYRKGNVTLDFSLRTDIKEELVDFLECLKAATEEVEQVIASRNR